MHSLRQECCAAQYSRYLITNFKKAEWKFRVNLYCLHNRTILTLYLVISSVWIEHRNFCVVATLSDHRNICLKRKIRDYQFWQNSLRTYNLIKISDPTFLFLMKFLAICEILLFMHSLHSFRVRLPPLLRLYHRNFNTVGFFSVRYHKLTKIMLHKS